MEVMYIINNKSTLLSNFWLSLCPKSQFSWIFCRANSQGAENPPGAFRLRWLCKNLHRPYSEQLAWSWVRYRRFPVQNVGVFGQSRALCQASGCLLAVAASEGPAWSFCCSKPAGHNRNWRFGGRNEGFAVELPITLIFFRLAMLHKNIWARYCQRPQKSGARLSELKRPTFLHSSGAGWKISENSGGKHRSSGAQFNRRNCRRTGNWAEFWGNGVFYFQSYFLGGFPIVFAIYWGK